MKMTVHAATSGRIESNRMQSVAQTHIQQIGEQRAARSTLCNCRAERDTKEDYEGALAGQVEMGWAVGPAVFVQRKYGPTVESKETVMYREERRGELDAEQARSESRTRLTTPVLRIDTSDEHYRTSTSESYGTDSNRRRTRGHEQHTSRPLQPSGRDAIQNKQTNINA
jgi:hypothetical protein